MENGGCGFAVVVVICGGNFHFPFSFFMGHEKGVTLSPWRSYPIGSSFSSFFTKDSFFEDV